MCARVWYGRILLLCACLILPVRPGFAQHAQVLLRLPSAPGLQNLDLEACKGELCLRTDTYCLVKLPAEQCAALQQCGIAYEVLDNLPFSQPYYLITKPTAHAVTSPPPAGKILYADGPTTLMKMSEVEAGQWARAGYQLARVFERNLPSAAGPAQLQAQRSPRAAHSDLIDDLMGQLSEGSFRNYLQRLEDFRTRYAYSDSVVAAREWLFAQFRGMNYGEVRFDPFPLLGVIQQNVVATKTGTQNTSRTIVIGGHYDSIRNDGDSNTWAPGVDDNGTGTAGTLELARVLANAPLETRIMFVPFAAEEQGLWGSEHFATDAFQKGLSIDLMINMDMIGNVADEVLNLNILTDQRGQAYAQLFAQLTAHYTKLLPVIGASAGNSDHFPFQQFGYPALFIHEGDFSPNWHRTTDVLANVRVSYALEVLKAVVATVVTVAEAPAVPGGLTSVEPGDGSTQILRWLPNAEPDLAGYRLHWGSVHGAYDHVVYTTETSDTLRGLAEGETVFATVSAVDGEGMESLLSPEIQFKPLSLPVTPAAFEASCERDAIALSWQLTNAELDFTGYTLTRLGPGSVTQTFALDRAVTSFADHTAQPHELYRYSLQARDAGGNLSLPTTALRGRVATHDQGILVVHGTREGTGQPLQPTRAEVEAFYDRLLQPFQPVAKWMLADSTRQQVSMSDADLGIYSTVVWHSDVNQSTRPLTADTTTLKKYLQNGGRLFLGGWALAESAVRTNLVTKNFRPGEFAYDYLRIASVRTTPGSQRDFVGADALRGVYSDVTIDPAKVPVFGGNLLGMEVLQGLAQDPATQALYSYRSSAQPPSTSHGQPVALRHLSADRNLIVVDFPLYFLEETQAAQLLRQALTELGEVATAIAERDDNRQGPPAQFVLAQNYPNPLLLSGRKHSGDARAGHTVFRFVLPQTSPVTFRLYNLLGQVVSVLEEGVLPAGAHEVHWDGTNGSGELVRAGIYFYELRTLNAVLRRKMLAVE